MAFQNFSEYYYCFNLLDIKMPNEKKQLKYYERWMKKYSEVFKDNDFTCVEWELRCQKSMREIFTASNFFIEAKKNLEMRCFSSYYFCLYYALFHAIYSVLFFDTQSNIYNLLDITHRNIINIFVGVFANSSKDILTKDIEELFKELKYKREYYSYVTPFNNLFDYQNDINRLEIALAQCFQLSSFHS